MRSKIGVSTFYPKGARAMTRNKVTSSSRSTGFTLSPSHCSPLDVLDASVTAIAVGVVKLPVLNPQGMLRVSPGIFVSYLFSVSSNLTLAAKKTGADSVAVMLDSNAKMIGILPGKGRQIPDAPKKRKEPKPAKEPKPVSIAAAPKPRPPVKHKLKPLPKVLWTPVPVPPSFTLDRALPRIAIREFVLRFGELLDISRTHLEELEEIGGRRSPDLEDDDDIDVEMGWVGETCLRAILLGLLNLLLNDQPEDDDKQEKKAIQDAIQEIKASRANLSRIWSALASLRAEYAKMGNGSLFPDPLPPPQYTKVRATRSGALIGTGINVTTTAQLVLVVLPLIEMVLETQAVHDAFEEGAKEAKERTREERERAKIIREQWEETKKNPVRLPLYGLDNQTEMRECIL
jgi:hypothetical protein